MLSLRYASGQTDRQTDRHAHRNNWHPVGLSVGLSVTVVSRAKTAEPIEMSFGLRTWVGTKNHALDEGPDPHRKGQF